MVGQRGCRLRREVAIGLALCFAALSLAMSGTTSGSDAGGNPLPSLEGDYAGTVGWASHTGPLWPDNFLMLQHPVLRRTEVAFSLTFRPQGGGVKIKWDFDGEAVEAWIVGTISENNYRAPAELGVLCRMPEVRTARGVGDADLWFACEPDSAPGTLPAVLMALTVVDRRSDGFAGRVSLHFKRYDGRDRRYLLEASGALRRLAE